MAGPINKYKEKGIEIAEWAGKNGSSYTITKRYKDKTSGEYKDSKSFFESELGILSALLNQALAAKGVRPIEEPVTTDSVEFDEPPF